MGRKQCELEGCPKGAIAGGAGFCIAHGGGRRCQHRGCSKSARADTKRCIGHGGTSNPGSLIVSSCPGLPQSRPQNPAPACVCVDACRARSPCLPLPTGGRRCQEEECLQAARSGSDHCAAHGGGKRCLNVACNNLVKGRAQHCIAHGGGKRCEHEGCGKAASRGGTQHCVSHGGGRRCQREGCSKSVSKATPSDVFCRLCMPKRSHQAKSKQFGAQAEPSQLPPKKRAAALQPPARRAAPTVAKTDSDEELESDDEQEDSDEEVEEAEGEEEEEGSDDEEEQQEEEQKKDDECTLCGGDGGFLISCNFCARSFHFECLDKETLLSLTAESGDAAWACPRKVCKVLVPPYNPVHTTHGQRPLGREREPEVSLSRL
jgi:hypothetical protein